MDFHKALHWRYATKKMNGEIVPEEKVDNILTAIQMAPTSLGFQPFSLLLITDPELKQSILPIANNQSQVVDGSHLLVFAAWTQATGERIEAYMEQTSKLRNLSMEQLQPLRKMLDSVASKPADEFLNWSTQQTYIAFGFALAAAAVEEVDATPMEGFNRQQLDELLGLAEQKLTAVLLLPLGYREPENDWLAPMAKVRRPKDELIIKMDAMEMAKV